MSQPISDIIQVTTSRTSQSVARANFGVFMLVDEDNPASPHFSGRTKDYFSLTELDSDGYTVGDYVYDAATKIFSQNPKVEKIKVGVKFITTTPDASWTAALNAIRNADTGFYGFSILSTTLAIQKEVADWAQAQSDPKVLFFIRSADADIINVAPGGADIADYIESLSYNRSTVFYHPNAATNYIECAAAGERFPKDPAVGTWMFKTLVGIASYSLTGSQRQTALSKYANIYIERASIDMTEEGTVGNGRFLDEERGIDQLEAFIQEDLFELLVNSEKVPYNNNGIQQIRGALEGALDKAAVNIINPDYVTSVPDREDTALSDRQARILKDVTYTASLQGAIHKIEVQGTVTI